MTDWSPEPQPTHIDLQDLVWRFRRRFWHLLVPFLAALCAGYLYVHFAPRVYESSIVISAGEPASIAPQNQLMKPGDESGNDRDRTGKVDARIHSRPFLANLASDLQLTNDPLLRQAARRMAQRLRGVSADDLVKTLAIERLDACLFVAPEKASLIRVAFRSSDPVTAQRAATAVGQRLLDESRRGTLERAQERSDFATDQTSVYEDRLRRSEAALRTYQASIAARSVRGGTLSPANVDRARAVIERYQTDTDEVRTRLQASLARLAELGEDAVPRQIASPAAESLESRLVALEVSYATTRAQAPPTGGETADETTLRSQLKDLQESLFSEYRRVADGLPAGVSVEAKESAAGVALDRSLLRSYNAARARLESLITESNRAIVDQPTQQLELQRLQAAVDNDRALLQSLQKEATFSRISEAMQTTPMGMDVEIIEPAQIPLFPVSPDRNKIYAAAAVAALLAPLGLFAALEKLGAVVRTVEEAEREFGVRVIGVVPRVEGWRRPGSLLAQRWPIFASLLIVLLTLAMVVFGPSLRGAGRGTPPQATGSVQ